MSKLAQPINQELVWAAACMAFQTNGDQYLKVGVTTDGRSANRIIVDQLLAEPNAITDSACQQGQLVRDYIGKVATTAALKGTLDIWGQEMARVSQLEQVETTLDLNVIISMPATYARHLDRERVHARLAETTGEYTACIGDKLELDVEVLENKYSQKWATYYVTVVDTDNRAWYFAHRQSLNKGTQYTIRGTVKRLADRMVQLNRVKLLDKEKA